MVRLSSELLIRAPIERCFDLARDMEAHARTMAETGERIVAGKATGFLELNDEVTFEARHLGIRQRFTSKVVQIDRPYSFTDRMVRGAFRSLEHEHSFREVDEGTVMTDHLTLEAPWGLLGRLAEVAVLHRYMNRLIKNRALKLKQMAESTSLQ